MILRAHRYVALSFLRRFSLLFSSFGFLYFLIDYSINLSTFIKKKISFSETLGYYLSVYWMRFDFFAILCLLLASASTIVFFRERFELLAFQAGGISLRRLFRPLTLFSLFLSLLLAAHFEFLLPAAIASVDRFEQVSLKKGAVSLYRPKARSIELESGDTIFFTHLDPLSNALCNVYISTNTGEIYHLASYFPEARQGYNGMRFSETIAPFDHFDFSILLPPFQPLKQSKRASKSLSLSELLQKSTESSFPKKRAYQSHFVYKLALILLPFFLLPIVIYEGKRFHRNSKPIILFVGLFIAFTALYMGLQSLVLIGEQGTETGVIGTIFLMTAVFSFSTLKVFRT